MKRLLFFFLLLAIFFACNKDSKIKVVFRLKATLPNATDTLFVTGNRKELGDWKPNGKALVKKNDVWEGTIWVPKGFYLEYKFTRGDWDKEALSNQGTILPNYSVKILHDTILFHSIYKWKDIDLKTTGGVTGFVEDLGMLEYPGIKPRKVLVWLPPSYNEKKNKRYPVLYLHDGQNVFNPKTSFLGIDWQVDEVADSLIRHNLIKEIIIVAIYNTPDRSQEYSDSPKGNLYLEFLVKKLKPLIDQKYRTLSDRENTAIMGSSMGGLISFLAAWKYPEIFSMAGCLSPAFIYNHGRSIELVQKYKGPKPDIKIYIDNGGVGLEEKLQPGCDRMIKALKEKGFREGTDFTWYRDLKATHNEAAWAKRVWRPLTFFFKKN